MGKNNEKCQFCGLPKYEYGVRNCCEEGEAEEYAENLKKYKRERLNKLIEIVEKVTEANNKPNQLSLFGNDTQ